MIRKRGSVVSRLYFLVAVLPQILLAAPLDNAIQAEVRRSQVVPDGQDAYSIGFKLSYDVRFTNRSENSANIPEPNDGSEGATWIVLLSMESQQADGSWKYVVSPGMLAFKADTQFAPCGSVRPNETREIRNVAGRFVLFKNQLPGLGPKPTVRASLVLVCRQQDGTVQNTGVKTEPFTLVISKQP